MLQLRLRLLLLLFLILPLIYSYIVFDIFSVLPSLCLTFVTSPLAQRRFLSAFMLLHMRLSLLWLICRSFLVVFSCFTAIYFGICKLLLLSMSILGLVPHLSNGLLNAELGLMLPAVPRRFNGHS
jgi:hypothetical protein